MGLALDESKEEDEVFNEQGIKYVVSKDLFEKVKPVGIDYVESPRGGGFKLSSNLDSGGGCGSSCSSC